MIAREKQRRKAETFLALHNAPAILVLPNVWDVASARIFQLEGFQALATTSAGVAATLGYPDGERMTVEANLAVVRRIVERIDLPVSADIERGYATTVEGVARSARAVIDAGAVGLNLEDGTGDPSTPLFDQSLQIEKIAAIREVALSQGIPLVLNARTDVYLASEEKGTSRLRHAVERANAYRQAGADCVFVPDMGDLDRDAIAHLVREIDAPVNLIAGATTPPLAELERMGVSRVSFGPRAMRAALALLRRIAQEWRRTGTYARMSEDALSYSEVNRMFDYA